jgi:hypothetical protein
LLPPAHPHHHQGNRFVRPPLLHTPQLLSVPVLRLLLQLPLQQQAKVQAFSPTWPAPQRKFSSQLRLLGNVPTWRQGELVLTISHSGVAVGSSIGHAIGGFFGGGSAPAQSEQAQVAQTQGTTEQSSWGPRSCEVDAKQLTKCLDENQGNMQTCSWYLEQLVRLAPFSFNEPKIC